MANAAEFLITLNQQVSGPAGIATGALQQTQAAAKQLTDVLGSASAGAAAAGVRLAGVGDQLRDSAGKFIAAGDAAGMAAAKMRQAQQAADAARGPTRDLGESVSGMAMQSANAGGILGKLQQAIGALGPQGQAAAMAIGLATIAITAFVAAIAGGMALAIHMTETLGRMRMQFDALAGGAAAGGKVTAMVDKLGQSLPFATSQVAAWARGLVAAGVHGQRLEREIKAIASAQALLGAEGGGAAESLFKKLSEGGPEADAFMKKLQKNAKLAEHDLKAMGLQLSDIGGKAAAAKMTASQLADAISKALTAKGGKALAAEMNTFPAIFQKAKEGAMSLFAGVKTEGFMAAVSKLFGLFNKGGFAIQILKPLVTSVFGALFSWASKALGFAYNGFLRLAIVGVKAYIMAHPLIGAFRDLWGAVVKLGTALGIVGGKSSSLGILAFVGGMIKGAFQTVIWAIKGVVGAITWVVTSAAALIGKIKAALGGVGGAGKGAGGNLVSGLVSGILAGAGAVVSAVKGLASSALSAFTGLFGIKSHSRVMIRHGDENIAGALTEGVDRGAPKVERAMGRLGGKPGGVGAGKGGGGGGDTIFDFRGAVFGGDMDEGKIERLFVRILQRARRSASEMEPAPT